MSDELPTYPQTEVLVAGSDFNVDEVQVVTLTETTGGTFTLALDGEETANIAYNAANSAVSSALTSLSNVNAGDVTVTGSNGGPWTIAFHGQYEDEDVPTLVADDTSLTGGVGDDPTATVTTTTVGEGEADAVQIPENNEQVDGRLADQHRDDQTPEEVFASD